VSIAQRFGFEMVILVLSQRSELRSAWQERSAHASAGHAPRHTCTLVYIQVAGEARTILPDNSLIGVNERLANSVWHRHHLAAGACGEGT
jgi:hypothetical protein